MRKTILNEVESTLAYVAVKMLIEKCSEIQHTIELGSGDKFKFHIRKLKEKKNHKKRLLRDRAVKE